MKPYKLMVDLSGFALAIIFAAMFSTTASAIPAFARKHEMACSGCHAAWPLLNKVGRDFKENGFKFSRDDEPETSISDFLKLDENFPIAAMVKSRPYDKVQSGNRTIRALHEVELMVAGPITQDISTFFELEAEDENGFSAKVAVAYLSYHPFNFLNIAFAHAPVFGLDPYDTLSSPRRLTRNRSAVIDQRFGGADNGGRVRDPRQLIYAYGRPVENLYYGVGFSGIANDTEGVNADVGSARLAWDVFPELTVGAFGMWGECKSTAAKCATSRNFGRYGFDTQADFSNFRFQGAYIHTQGDRGVMPGKDKNHAFYLQGFYVFKNSERPWFVPSVRFDKYTKSDGKDDYDEITGNITYYMYENVKLFVEGWQQLNTPSGVKHDSRITFQIEAAF